jgi:hypothetical protein
LADSGCGREHRPSALRDGNKETLMISAKSEVEALLRQLPEDCTFEDIQYHLYVIEKVRKGLQAADEGNGHTQEEVEQRLSKWTSK